MSRTDEARQEVTCCSDAVGVEADRHDEEHQPLLVRGINSTIPVRRLREQARNQQRQQATLLKGHARRLRDMQDAEYIDTTPTQADLRITWRTPVEKKRRQPVLKAA